MAAMARGNSAGAGTSAGSRIPGSAWSARHQRCWGVMTAVHAPRSGNRGRRLRRPARGAAGRRSRRQGGRSPRIAAAAAAGGRPRAATARCGGRSGSPAAAGNRPPRSGSAPIKDAPDCFAIHKPGPPAPHPRSATTSSVAFDSAAVAPAVPAEATSLAAHGRPPRQPPGPPEQEGKPR